MPRRRKSQEPQQLELPFAEDGFEAAAQLNDLRDMTPAKFKIYQLQKQLRIQLQRNWELQAKLAHYEQRAVN